MSNDSLLDVDALRKSYGAREAVRSISFSLGRGEIFGLLGPNGAGKTTTIEMIAGILEPSGGSIKPAGKLGLVPQTIALYPTLTAEENLHFFGRIHGLSKERVKSRTQLMLDLSGLTSRARDPVCEFSGGMKRRLNLACGVVHEPDVVLLDEPTVGVDPQSREHIYEAMAGFAKEGMALLLTTHYMQEAERLCGRLAIMDEGKFIAEGTVDELVEGAALEHTVELDLVRAPSEALRKKMESFGARLLPEGSYVLTGKSSTQSLPAMLAMVVADGNDVHELNVHRPDLGDVFLHLTGKGLRD
jgi:ABC-2 type transport system ATP-binding protein